MSTHAPGMTIPERAFALHYNTFDLAGGAPINGREMLATQRWAKAFQLAHHLSYLYH